jgi:hypothetical protein
MAASSLRKTSDRFGHLVEHSQGLYACFEEDGSLLYRARILGLSFDLNRMVFLRLGPLDDVFKWTSQYKKVLRENGNLFEAADVQTISVPSDVEPSLLTQLLQKGSPFLKSFLQRVRVI